MRIVHNFRRDRSFLQGGLGRRIGKYNLGASSNIKNENVPFPLSFTTLSYISKVDFRNISVYSYKKYIQDNNCNRSPVFRQN